jgi:hypothetical protein
MHLVNAEKIRKGKAKRFVNWGVYLPADMITTNDPLPDLVDVNCFFFRVVVVNCQMHAN